MNSTLKADNATVRRPHIGIVGAGISGLRCADILLGHGFKVTILEARNRIGGRIEQSTELGYPVDTGPNWIHAVANQNETHAIKDLAHSTNTPLRSWSQDQAVFDSSGTILPYEVTERLTTLMWDIIEEGFKFSADARDRHELSHIAKEESLYDFLQRRAADLVFNQNERKWLLQIAEGFGAYIGEPIWRQSLRFAWMEECCGGDEEFVASDYSKILQAAAKPALSGANILLDKHVVMVKAPESRDLKSKVEILTQDGDSHEFDEVIITTPLGWLKKNPAAFSPALPDRLSSAICNIGQSQLEKVYISFPGVFWQPQSSKAPRPSCTTFLTPDYAKETNPDGWPQELWDLSMSDAPHDHPTMLFYIYGDCARHVVSNIYQKSKEEKFSFLNDFFRPYYSKLPGYDRDSLDCQPKAILATEWFEDELSGCASYSNFQTGIEEADVDVSTIRHGCPSRRLWFCGEHTAPFQEFGTVAGAYLSGEAVANRIVHMDANKE